MEYTRTNVLLVVLLALVPLNSGCRIVKETDRHLKLRRALAGKSANDPSGLFDESVALPVPSSFDGLSGRLAATGYRVRCTGGTLAAWRGVSIYPVRVLFLAGMFCLFAGILVSLTTRTTHRMSVIEGEPLPTATGGGGLVERITLKTGAGPILAKILTMDVAPSDSGDGRKVFGLYPPSLYRGYFVYPRYIAIASIIRFSAPGGQTAYEKQAVMNIYPAGKEDRVEIPGSPYRILFSMIQPEDGSDPYVTGRITYLFKLMNGKEVIFAGSLPVGGEFVRDGYRLAIPEGKRMVITDFIQDYGVLLVWGAAIFFLAAGCIWLPVTIFLPRREMLFVSAPDNIHACSRSEGGGRKHGGVFHEALDFLEAGMADRQPFDGGSAEK